MKKLTGKILLALSFCMLSFLVPHSFSQAKVLDLNIYNGDMPGDLENYYDEEKEYVDEEDLYFPGDSGKITAKSSYYFEEIAKVEFVSTDSNIVSVDAEGNYLVKSTGFATIHVTGWDKDGDVILRGGHSFLVGGDMSQTTLSKNSIQAYLFGQSYETDETDEIVIPLKNAPDLKYCSFSLVSSTNGDWVNSRLDKEQKAIVITTLRSGKTTLTFRINGKEFTVTIHVSEVTMKKNSALLKYKEKTTLKIKGYSGKIKWVSTNKKVATVSSKGAIKAKKKTGNTVVYAQIGEHRLGCAVSVVSSKMKKVINRAKKIYKTCKYSQPLRMSSKYYDCSSLVWKSYRLMGKTLGNRNYAPVAADIAKWCAGKKKMVKGGVSEKNITKMKLRPGDLVFQTGAKNGRYKGIYHVEMFVGYRCYGFSGNTPMLMPCWAARYDGYAYGAKLVGRP